MMARYVPYSYEFKQDWNKFVQESNNGTFLFNRNYMNYHDYIFEDRSLMIYINNELVALFPATIENNSVNNKSDLFVLSSHSGLTYGGLIMKSKIKTIECINMFNDIIKYYKYYYPFIKQIIYKPVPSMYRKFPSEEEQYMLYRSGAQLISRDISTVVYLGTTNILSNRRLRGIRKAEKNNISIYYANMLPNKNEILEKYWKVVEENLMVYHNTKPVHTFEEIKLLYNRFPQNIHLYITVKNDNVFDILSGTILYTSNNVVHCQYIGSSKEGKKLGANDYLFSYLIDYYRSPGNKNNRHFKYFDFGISNTRNPHVLNEGLITYKEEFGGFSVCYDKYEIQI